VALFGNKKQTPSFTSPPLQAAAGSSAMVGQFYSYSVGASTELALSNATVARATQMILSMVGCLPLRHYTKQFNGERYEKIYLENEAWMDQPDPKSTMNFIMSNTAMDIMMRGRAFWYITSRSSATGRPLSFQWIPASMVTTNDQSGPQFFGQSDQVMFNGIQLPTEDVIQFISGVQGFLFTGARTITTALKLDQAAERFASNEIAAGWLTVGENTEQMSAEDLGELAASWRQARQTGAIGALAGGVTFNEFKSDPNKLQLLESRQYSSLEVSRQVGVPAYLLGIAVGGYTYQNAQQARQDLYLFGAKQVLDVIQMTLSMTNVLPRNRFVEFDVDNYIYENHLAEVPVEEARDRDREEMYS
jgi:phage portal protein BeeE